MVSTAVVEAGRAAIGTVGTTLPVTFTDAPPIDLQRRSVARLEAAGYGAVWTNEVVGGKDAFVQMALLLAATDRLAFGTKIANIWAREPQTTRAAAAQLAEAYPHRFLHGLGVGYPAQAQAAGKDYGKPISTLRDYVTRMDEQTWPPAPAVEHPRLIAANGPKLLALAAEIADGALPAMLPPTFTAQAREILGPDKILVMGLSVMPGATRDDARQTIAMMFGGPDGARRLVGLGFTEEEATGFGDRLVDAIVAYGHPDRIAARIHEHLTAGADHVSLLLPVNTDFATGIDQLAALAPAILDQSMVR
jgi:probable F420-dependent oxidoreductase